MMRSPTKTQATIDFQNNHADLRKLIESARYLAFTNKTPKAIAEFEKLVDLYNDFGKKENAQTGFLLTKKID
jgi:hypothetical protein